MRLSWKLCDVHLIRAFACFRTPACSLVDYGDCVVYWVVFHILIDLLYSNAFLVVIKVIYLESTDTSKHRAVVVSSVNFQCSSNARFMKWMELLIGDEFIRTLPRIVQYLRNSALWLRCNCKRFIQELSEAVQKYGKNWAIHNLKFIIELLDSNSCDANSAR